MICNARAWVVLMKRLGYTQFVAQGGDWDALIVEMMGYKPPEPISIHTNMPGAVPPDVSKAIQVRMKTRRKKGEVAERGILPPIKSLLPIATPYSGAGLEMYFYCNYGDENELISY